VSQKSSQQLKISYFPIDSFSKLVAMVLKYSSAETGPNKCSLLPKILLVAVRIIQRDSEEKKASFNPRPYFRLFISLLYDLISSDLHSDGANFQVHFLLTMYSCSTISNITIWFGVTGFDCICKCIPCTATLENSFLEVCSTLLTPHINFLILCQTLP
jgi:hypothetical protein